MNKSFEDFAKETTEKLIHKETDPNNGYDVLSVSIYNSALKATLEVLKEYHAEYFTK